MKGEVPDIYFLPSLPQLDMLGIWPVLSSHICQDAGSPGLLCVSYWIGML